MGIANLQGAIAKLQRANEHNEAFYNEIRMFSSLHTDPVRIDFQHEDGWYVLSLSPPPALPKRITLIAGDCLTNVRAALDHVVWQLVLREDEEPTQHNSFPIYEASQEFMDKVKTPAQRRKRNLLKGIPVNGDAWTLIEQAQPFNCPKPQNHILFFLDKLVNIDKHRALLVQHTFLDKKKLLDCIRWRPGIKPIDLHAPQVPLSPEKPTVILRFRLSTEVDLATNPCMDMEGDLSPIPMIGDTKTQVTLNLFRELVTDMGRLLEQFTTLPRVQA